MDAGKVCAICVMWIAIAAIAFHDGFAAFLIAFLAAGATGAIARS